MTYFPGVRLPDSVYSQKPSHPRMKWHVDMARESVGQFVVEIVVGKRRRGGFRYGQIQTPRPQGLFRNVPVVVYLYASQARRVRTGPSSAFVNWSSQASQQPRFHREGRVSGSCHRRYSDSYGRCQLEDGH